MERPKTIQWTVIPAPSRLATFLWAIVWFLALIVFCIVIPVQFVLRRWDRIRR
jgi:disulfide bond formation protein DsbB